MNTVETQMHGACFCGTYTFEAQSAPLFRAICHCTICQEFNQASFGDILLFRSGDVSSAGLEQTTFKYHANPPILSRGKCDSCARPTVEWLGTPPKPQFTIIPSANVADQDALPEPSFHMFYNKRIADVDDGLPKYRWYLPSQTKFILSTVRALLRRR